MNNFTLYDFLRSRFKYGEELFSVIESKIYYHGLQFREQPVRKSFFQLVATLSRSMLMWSAAKALYKPYKERCVFNNCYFGLRSHLNAEGYSVFNFPWEIRKAAPSAGFVDFIFLTRLRVRLSNCTIAELQRENGFEKEIDKAVVIIEQTLKKWKPAGVFLSSDTGFFERLMISAARRQNIPSFILMHGAAPRYATADIDSRSDYYLVFGESYREQFQKIGHRPERLKVVGHPVYSNRKKPSTFQFGLQDILVISKTTPGQNIQIPDNISGQDKSSMKLSDRGNSILYLMMIENVLKKMNVASVKLRLHPSESRDWYYKHIDTVFFQLDNDELSETLNNATLVIGPTSSTFIDALMSGVNYVVFEPSLSKNRDILNHFIGYPFDGSEEKVPVAFSERQLENILSNKNGVDPLILTKLIHSSFTLREILELIK